MVGDLLPSVRERALLAVGALLFIGDVLAEHVPILNLPSQSVNEWPASLVFEVEAEALRRCAAGALVPRAIAVCKLRAHHRVVVEHVLPVIGQLVGLLPHRQRLDHRRLLAAAAARARTVSEVAHAIEAKTLALDSHRALAELVDQGRAAKLSTACWVARGAAAMAQGLALLCVGSSPSWQQHPRAGPNLPAKPGVEGSYCFPIEVQAVRVGLLWLPLSSP
mmetsp:Transcript_62958/g.163375  ORF Transcript_62958/g.163375 Transcript_62958/m.163375 type:complete len:221 (+) Transcript_62958:2271-2933(+)